MLIIKTVLSFFLVYFGWGSLYLAIRIAVQSIPPFLMAGASSLAAGFFLYIAALLTGSAAPKPAQWKNAFFAGASMLALGNGCVVWAEQKVPSAITALILATEPAWFALLGWLMLKGPKPAKGMWIGILVGFAGVVFLVWAGVSEIRVYSWVDAFLILIAAISWSWGSLYSRKTSADTSPLLSMAMPVLIGGAILLLCSFAAGEWQHFKPQNVSSPSLAAFAYITIVSYCFTYTAYGWLLKNVRIEKISTYAYINPLAALILGAWIAHESITPATLIGAGAIILSVMIVLKHSTPNRMEKSQ